MIVRARTVLPVAAPPVPNGAIAVSDNKIQAVGSWTEIKSEFTNGELTDLGDVVLLPGLVNAHCHLDYTDMAGLWPPPGKFTDWIPRMLAAKAEWSYTDYANSWLHGAKMLLHSGVTTVADIECVPELLPEVWDSTPLRIISFLEMTGVRLKRDPAKILGDAIRKSESLAHPRCAVALSPHAPYSTSLELLRLCAQAARDQNLRLTTHVAESDLEYEMFAHARGGMFDWLKKNGRDNSDCGFGSPVQHLEQAGLLGKNFLAAHANYLDKNDLRLLARRKVSVVHCPRSHAYFRHLPFMRERLANAGANLCLGTDSLATVRVAGEQKPELNLFEEMRALADADRAVSPAEVLRMATLNGARALGQRGQIGELRAAALADLIAIPVSGKHGEINETVLAHDGPVQASMIDGRWVIPPK